MPQPQHSFNISHDKPLQMWNNKQGDDDSWEVRAFEEDTGNLMGCTWPPRSYRCTFCRREFRSAQALGGHMNVHRRDRARLHQAPLSSNISANPSSTFLIANGVYLLCSLPDPNANITDSPSTIFTVTPYRDNDAVLPSVQSTDFPASVSFSFCHPNNTITNSNGNNHVNTETTATEELDLELRLGRGRPPPS